MRFMSYFVKTRYNSLQNGGRWLASHGDAGMFLDAVLHIAAEWGSPKTL